MGGLDPRLRICPGRPIAESPEFSESSGRPGRARPLGLNASKDRESESSSKSSSNSSCSKRLWPCMEKRKGGEGDTRHETKETVKKKKGTQQERK